MAIPRFWPVLAPQPLAIVKNINVKYTVHSRHGFVDDVDVSFHGLLIFSPRPLLFGCAGAPFFSFYLSHEQLGQTDTINKSAS